MSFKKIFPLFTLAVIVLSGCGASTPTVSSSPTPELVVATATPPLPTSTPEVPAAAIVNGERIWQSDFDRELKQYNASQANSAVGGSSSTAAQSVIQSMIEDVLLAQGAAEEGFTVDDSLLQQRKDQLEQKLGSQNALDTWLTSEGYSPEEFDRALRTSIAAAWMRDKITTGVPKTADQVHVRQIVFSEQANAQAVLQEVRSGSDFATLAEEYNPVTRGDIGWFPRGYIRQPEVEEAAFNLTPGDVSEVIKTKIGYHLIQVIERDANRALSPDAYVTLQRQALQHWLTEKQKSSQIEIRVQ